MHNWNHSLKQAALAVVAAFAFLAPATAGAATVVNGDFETGNLSGWQVFNSSSSGNWFAYSGDRPPLSGDDGNVFIRPPQGTFAALTDESSPDTAILSQDIALEPFWTHQLALTLYYRSQDPIAVPEPNTLASDGTADENQQLRVDVMRAGTPIDSLNPVDILTTVFANKNGDSQELNPTLFTADLTPFGGQTVRLRIANAVQEDIFNAGVDGVSITSVAPPPPPPSNLISRGKLTLNKKKGTGKLAINVPGAGTLTAIAKGKGKAKRIRNAGLTVTAAGTVKAPLNPNGVGKKILNEKGKLKARIDVTFTPTGGLPNTQTYKVTLKKTLDK
jgi:hypothetical protein